MYTVGGSLAWILQSYCLTSHFSSPQDPIVPRNNALKILLPHICTPLTFINAQKWKNDAYLDWVWNNAKWPTPSKSWRRARRTRKFKRSSPRFETDNICLIWLSQFLTDIERVDGIAAAFETEDTDGAAQLEGLCEVLELTGKVQHSVFSTISNISELTGSNILQTRLLPWLGSGFIGAFLISLSTK